MAVVIPVDAELDERSATAAANRARRVFSDAGRDVGREFSDSMAQGMRSGEESIRRSAGRASDAYDRMADAAGRVREAEDRLERARSGGNNSQIVSRAEALERARRAEARATREATEAYRDYEDAANGAGQSIMDSLRGSIAGAGASGQDAANEFVGGFAGASMLTRLGAAGGPIGLALAGVAVLGVGAGKLLASGIADGLATIQLQDQFQASMGLDEASMSRFANAAGQAYANNFGESLADNLATARSALQSGLIEPTSSDVDVQNVIQQVQGVSSVTGASAQELSRSVTTLMRTGFAGSVSEALDVITAGFQKGMDVSQDWLDTINEYSTQFRKLGLDAGEFMTLLHQGLEGGARDTDKVADSLKEFSIRAVDGSKSTKEGFEALGFNADEMGRRFAAGGDSAKVAFGAVLEALRSTGDAQQQALIWQRLFGTQWEDMGDAINRLSLDPAKNEFRDLQGTSETATKTATDNFISEWEAATRAVSQAFSNLKTEIADWFSSIPGLRELLRAVPGLLGVGEDYKGPPIPTAPKVYGPANPLPVAGPQMGGGLGDLLSPGAGPSGSGLPPALNGPQLDPHGAGDYYKKLYPQQPVTAGPPAPVPGDRTPIPGADAAGGGDKAKPSFDPSQYSVDAIAVPGAMPGVPNAAAIGQVDPQKVYDAETSLMSSRNSVEQARIRVLELEAEGTATAQELAQARNGVTMAERQYVSAQTKLAEAQQGTWKKMEGAAKSFSQGMDQIGVALDNDLGISKGLPGLAENLVKFVGSLAAAPLEAQLAAVTKYNPIQGGHGLMGILGAQGVFGPQYTQSQYAQQSSAMGPAMLQPGVGGGQPYGLPGDTDTGGYGSSGAVFPPWVHALEQAFGVKASTYNGHQEDGANGVTSGGLKVAPNPNHENRGIDWSGSVQNMQRFADYLATIPGSLEQVIWQNPSTGRSTEVGEGRPWPGLYGQGTLAEHQNHVHTRQPAAIPVPGMPGPVAGGGGGLSPQQWANIAGAEASGNWQANTGNGYSGGLQFAPSTWNAFGGPQYAPQAWQATPEQQMAVGNNVLAGQGPGAWPATSAAHPDWFQQGLPAFGGGGGPMAGGMPQAAPLGGNTGTAFPAMPGGGGVGIDGGGLLGTAMAAGGTALDLMAPGAGQAAQIGMKLLNRTIQYGSQAAGIGVSGLMETFLPSSSPLGNLGNSWFGKLAAGFASARPALPNTAGQQAPPNPNAHGQGGGQPGPTIGTQIDKLEYTNNEATQGSGVNDLTRNLEAQNAPTGVR